MSAPQITLQEFLAYGGRQLAPTPWITIDQKRVDTFAECTDDHQFIHLDPERARRETPFGGTIAHGYLVLSLIPPHLPPDLPRIRDLGFELNYGLDRVRFITPVRVGKRVRLHTKVVSVTEKGPGRVLFKMEKTMEIEGEDKPAYVAEQLGMYLAGAPA